MLLPLFAALVAASTAVLIFAGGLVTSTGSGLSVPDWPNTYGWFMWAFPTSKMGGRIFYEHTHLLIASKGGFLIGATMRHTGAGLAIPDFPLSFGHLIPPYWDPKIAIHFAHRAGAATVTLLVLATAGHVFFHHRNHSELRRPAILLLILLALQITLGALTVLSHKQFIINSLHVVNGALVLVTSLVLTLRAHRAKFGDVAGSAS